MQKTNTRRGFTLIELLVVVLIIGILAAVAVPQYKMAVAKSRAMQMLPIIRALMLADNAYYLANGSRQSNVNLLDISLPGDCTALEGPGLPEGQVWKCGKDFVIDNANGRSPAAYFCLSANTTYNTCTSKSDFKIAYSYDSTENRQKSNCVFYSDFGKKVCQSLPFEKYKDGNS